jgi:hypothetical protein
MRNYEFKAPMTVGTIVASLVVWATVWTAIIAVVVHFIRKFW